MRFFLLMLVFLSLASPASASTYDRVMQKNEIRCGYTFYSVGLYKNLETGEIEGIYKDVIEAVGKLLDLKIVWAEEVGWGQQIEGLNAGRYDMICSPASITGPRTKAADYSLTLYYSPVWVWVKDFKEVRDALNKESIKLSTMDGEQTEAMAQLYFPLAQRVSLPQSADFSMLMMQVATGKADATFAEPLPVYEFNEKNPTQKLKKIKDDNPLKLVPNIFLLKRGEGEFKAMLNNALTELFLDGTIDRAIDKFEKYPQSYVRNQQFE